MRHIYYLDEHMEDEGEYTGEGREEIKDNDVRHHAGDDDEIDGVNLPQREDTKKGRNFNNLTKHDSESTNS